MANNYKNVQAIITSTGSYDPMYTTPNETTAVVKSIKLYNTDGSSRAVTTAIRDSSTSTDYEYDKVTVDPSNSVNLLTFNNVLVLEAGDIIKMQAPAGNVIKMTAAVLEMTRA